MSEFVGVSGKSKASFLYSNRQLTDARNIHRKVHKPTLTIQLLFAKSFRDFKLKSVNLSAHVNFTQASQLQPQMLAKQPKLSTDSISTYRYDLYTRSEL